MKQIKRLAFVAAIGISALFAGCASTALPIPLAIPTPQQLVTDFCPVVNADLKLIAASLLLNASQKQVLNGVPGNASQPGVIAINEAVCAAGGTINVSDLTALNATAFPALIGLVAALPMLPNQPAILFGLQAVAPIVNQITEQIQAAVTAKTATPAVAAASAASAPLAASAIQ
jgi:hypothetical protein